MARGKRVEIVKLTVDGVEVDAKECTKCGEIKALGEFAINRRGKGGRLSWCLLCSRKVGSSLRKRGNPSGKRRKRTRWTTQTFNAHIGKTTGGKYSIIGDYLTTHIPVKVRHNVCGHEWLVLPHTIIRFGASCPMCASSGYRKTHAAFVREVEGIVGDRYTVLSEYTYSSSHILMRHNSCGYSWSIIPSNFLSGGTRCPACAASKGEARVVNYLDRCEYTFTREQTFDDCRNKRPLRFDFAVTLTDQVIIIEYDGEQHSRPVDFAGRGAKWAERQFRRVQRNDAIKTEYCRVNGIPLIRIKHTQFDEIEAILDRELSALGVTGKRSNTDNNDNTQKEDAA